MKVSPSLFIFFVTILLGQQVIALKIEGKVIRIHDGDTLTITSPVLTSTKNIRMIGIDSPEVDFMGHTQGESALAARDYLRGLLPIGSKITVDMGRDGSLNERRLLATIFLGNININKEMLRKGHAAPYFIEPFDKGLMREYLLISREVFEKEIGIFSENIELPYDFRMRVQDKTGTNYVADIESKVLYYPEESSQVAPYKRLFISSLERAQILGFKLRED